MKNLSNSYTLFGISSDSQLNFTARYLVQVSYTIDLSLNDKISASKYSFCVRKDQIIDFIKDSKNLSDSNKEAQLKDNDSKSYIKLRKQNGDSNYEFEVYLIGALEEKGANANIVTDELNTINLLKYLRDLLYEVDDIGYEKTYEQEFLKRKFVIPEL